MPRLASLQETKTSPIAGLINTQHPIPMRLSVSESKRKDIVASRRDLKQRSRLVAQRKSV